MHACVARREPALSAGDGGLRQRGRRARRHARRTALGLQGGPLHPQRLVFAGELLDAGAYCLEFLLNLGQARVESVRGLDHLPSFPSRVVVSSSAGGRVWHQVDARSLLRGALLGIMHSSQHHTAEHGERLRAPVRAPCAPVFTEPGAFL